uniref:Uncharacterized protein n=1 Tax=Anopheles dirus TaxID=7168 RepID=A0A182NYR1_9DIPT
MESDDKSEIKIKEKLNLHVKKRLQESTKDAPNEKNDAKDTSSTSTTVANSSSAPKAKRQKTKGSSKQAAANAATAGTAATIASTGVRTSDLLLSPGAANSNDTTNSSINSTDQDAELNDREPCEKGDKPVKPSQRMDIFSLILNQKKSSLMCDPEVIKFMNSLSESKK